jgi:hypothetical protein
MFIIIFSYWWYEFYLKKLCCHVVIFIHIAMNKQFEDTKGVIRSRAWENDWQYNDQQKKVLRLGHNLSILIRSVSCSQYCMWFWIVHWLSIRFSRKLLYLGDTLSDTGGKGRVCLKIYLCHVNVYNYLFLLMIWILLEDVLLSCRHIYTYNIE